MQKYPSIVPFLDDILKIDKGISKVVEVQLYLRDFNMKIDFIPENDSWNSVLNDECDAKIVLVVETGALISNSNVQSGYVVSRKERTRRSMSKSYSSSGIGLSEDSKKGKTSTQPLNADEETIAIELQYSAAGEGVVWTPTSTVGDQHESRIVEEGYEKAETVHGAIPLSTVVDYLKLSQYKIFTRYLKNVTELSRLPGVFTERHFSTELFRYLHFVTRTRDDGVVDASSPRWRSVPLSQELQAMVPKGQQHDESTLKFTRIY